MGKKACGFTEMETKRFCVLFENMRVDGPFVLFVLSGAVIG